MTESVETRLERRTACLERTLLPPSHLRMRCAALGLVNSHKEEKEAQKACAFQVKGQSLKLT